MIRRRNGKRPSLNLANNCEWDPSESRHAKDDDDHHRTTHAEVIVGALGQFRTWEWIPQPRAKR